MYSLCSAQINSTWVANMIHIAEIQRHSIQPSIHTEFWYGREGRCSFTNTAASDLWDLVVPGQTCKDRKHGSDIETGMSSSWSIRVCDHVIFFYRFLYVKLIGKKKNPAESIPLLGLGPTSNHWDINWAESVRCLFQSAGWFPGFTESVPAHTSRCLITVLSPSQA